MKGLKRLTLLQMIMSATSYVMDITKDILIVSQISLALGGFKKIFLNYQECMSGVSNPKHEKSENILIQFWFADCLYLDWNNFHSLVNE